MDPQYIDFLAGYRYDTNEVLIKQNGPVLELIIEGYWYRTVLWEVPLMASISELYFEMTNQFPYDVKELEVRNKNKAESIASVEALYSEFGTRRRFSFKVQAQVVNNLKLYGLGHMLGTSNVFLAKMNDLVPHGTVAHEWFQAHAAMFGYLRGNIEALESWVKVYGGNLGMALPDTFTSDIFYKYAFNTKYAKLFDGVRQDSGDPINFIDRTVSHYKSLRIQPNLKTILFSDNIKSIDLIKEIKGALKLRDLNDRPSDRYGIGTWLSNDVGVKPLNIVIKLTGLDFGHGWVDTVKISDSPTKHTGEPDAVKFCLASLGL